MLVYAVVIHKENNTAYGVSVPDLPGCISAGDTVDEAMTMIREAIELHLEGMIEDGQAIPSARSLEDVRSGRQFRGAAAFALVQIDTSNLRSKAVRINITLPERVLARIDAAAKRSGETRSGLIAAAASEYIARKAGY